MYMCNKVEETERQRWDAIQSERTESLQQKMTKVFVETATSHVIESNQAMREEWTQCGKCVYARVNVEVVWRKREGGKTRRGQTVEWRATMKTNNK